jgi:hypothetical protein
VAVSINGRSLSAALLDAVVEALERDPEVSSAAISVYEEIARATGRDSDNEITMERLTARMDATVSTISQWCAELEWGNVIVRGHDGEHGGSVRLASPSELRERHVSTGSANR